MSMTLNIRCYIERVEYWRKNSQSVLVELNNNFEQHIELPDMMTEIGVYKAVDWMGRSEVQLVAQRQILEVA